MADLSLHQFLVVYTWFPLTGLLLLMLLIARFYQKFSDVRMFYWFYLTPIVLFGAGSVRYASVSRWAGDAIGDVLMGLGGLCLIALSLRLYQRMGQKSTSSIKSPPTSPHEAS